MVIEEEEGQNLGIVRLFHIIDRREEKKERQRVKRRLFKDKVDVNTSNDKMIVTNKNMDDTKSPHNTEMVDNDTKIKEDNIKDNTKVIQKVMVNTSNNKKVIKDENLDDNKAFHDNQMGDNDTKIKVGDKKENVINLHHLATKPQQAHSIVWCPRVNRFVQNVSKNHEPLKLEIETLHDIELKIDDYSVRRTREQSPNCPDTGVSVTISGKSLMNKMGLTNNNLMRDNTRVSAAEGTSIKVWGFVPVKL